MKIESQLLEDHQVELTVDVDTEIMEANKRKAASQLARRGKIPGFRPGKAPYEVVVRHYGEAAIIEQAMDLLVDDIYPKVLDESNVKPAAPGSLEKIESLDPPKLVFRVPLAPEVDLGDYQKIRMAYKWSPPGKKELEAALEEVRQMYATTESVDRPVQSGDYVLIDVAGELDEPPAPGGEELPISRNGYATVIHESGQEEEWPFRGFTKQLVGMQAEESKAVDHRYPKDHEDERLQGRKVTFDVTVKAIRSMTLPELDDELARLTGQFDTLEALKDALAKDLEARAKSEYDDEYYARLIDKVIEGASIKYPPQMVANESEQVLDDLRQRLSQQGLDLDTYFRLRQTSREKFLEEETAPIAKKRIERSLVLDQLAKAENVKMDESALQMEFGQTLTELQYQGLDLGKLRGGKRGQQQVAEAVAMESANRLMTRKILERMKEIANESGATKAKSKRSTAAKEDDAQEKPATKAAPKKSARSKVKSPPTSSRASKGEEQA